jgi:hypothetical protein
MLMRLQMRIIIIYNINCEAILSSIFTIQLSTQRAHSRQLLANFFIIYHQRIV